MNLLYKHVLAGLRARLLRTLRASRVGFKRPHIWAAVPEKNRRNRHVAAGRCTPPSPSPSTGEGVAGKGFLQSSLSVLQQQ